MTDRVSADREARIRRALEHLRNDTTDQVDKIEPFEAAEFTDPVLAARERDLVFGRVPSIVAHGSELPKTYDFKTIRMPRNNVIISRQKDGGVKAFVNLCRHRGALLEEEPCGKRRLFSCPYHRWSYDIDGSLRTITRDNTVGEVDRTTWGSWSFPVKSATGSCGSSTGSAPRSMSPAGWARRWTRSSPATTSTPGLRPRAKHSMSRSTGRSCRTRSWTATTSSTPTRTPRRKIIHTNIMAFEDFGRHARFVAPRKTIDRWLEEDPGDASLVNYVTETHFLGPNSTLLKQPDHFQLLTFRPHPATRTFRHGDAADRAAAGGGRHRRRQLGRSCGTRTGRSCSPSCTARTSRCCGRPSEACRVATAGPMLLGRNEVANHLFRRTIQRLLAESDEEVTGAP